MRIFGMVLAATFALACATAQAQAYRWVDKDGKVRYGDVAPPGVKATALKPPPGGAAAPSTASKDATSKDAKKGPLTPAEQEQAFRDRKLKGKEAQDKAEKDRAEAEQTRLACASAQEGVRSMERGGRIATVNAQGETVFLEDEDRAARIEQLRKVAVEACK